METKFDFESAIDRHNTGSWKWDSVCEPVRSLGYLPLTIADMEFSMPQPVKDALHRAVDHGICGYTEPDDVYFNSIAGYFTRRHGFTPQKGSLCCTSGVVPALGLAVRSFTNEGDSIIIQPPVYPPFKRTVDINHRKLVENPLILNDGHYEMNLEQLEDLCHDGAKMLILCSPHNPVGRVWTRDELKAVADICIRHNVIVLSDEIHADITYGNNHHTVMATIPGMLERSIICTAMSKTFNLAGLMCSNIFIHNEEMREKFKERIGIDGSHCVPFFGRAASIAAHTECDEWVDGLVAYVNETFNMCYSFFKERLPMIECIRAEGTYLLWMDFRKLGMNDADLESFMINRAHIASDEGYIFGTGGSGFERFNLAAPRREIESALMRLESAIKSL